MLQKGYKREAKGMAVLRCFIGLFIMIVVILVAYFMLRLDYSDKLDPDASVRPYVATTETPQPTSEPTLLPESTDSQGLTENGTTEPAQATATPEPTQEPTATPSPTPEPTATPAPTAIPESSISAMKYSGFTLPALSTSNADLAITYSYRSAADNYRILVIRGYAYINDPSFDGSNAQLYLVINQSTGQSALALPVMSAGISGVDHSDALCQNASACDFEAVIDVKDFADEIYSLGVVIGYKTDDGANYEYFTFPGDTTFTVLNQQVISDLRVTSAE